VQCLQTKSEAPAVAAH